jgi:hypothetical protein
MASRKESARKAPVEMLVSSRSPDRRRGPGRPPVHDEAWSKVTVVLFDRQIAFLDQLARSVRARSGAAVSRAQVIRALVDAVEKADLDLTASRSEADMTATILAHLGRYRLTS